MPPKIQTVDIGGRKFKAREGALRKQLQVPESYKFTKSDLEKIKNVEDGKNFKFLGKEFVMTRLLKKRATLAIVLMRGNR